MLHFYTTFTGYRTLFCSCLHIFFCIRTRSVRKRIRRIFRSRSSSSSQVYSVHPGPGAKVLTFRVLCPPNLHSCLILSYRFLKCKQKGQAENLRLSSCPFCILHLLCCLFHEKRTCTCRLLNLMCMPYRCTVYCLLCSVVTDFCDKFLNLLHTLFLPFFFL